MASDALEIVYRVEGADGTSLQFHVRLDAQTLEQLPPDSSHTLPDWVALETDQCAGCPLDSNSSPHCPAARSLALLVSEAGDLVSFSPVDVEVQMPGKDIHANVPMQNALSSLVGLCMATSGCPRLNFLKPMARFHVPFATMEETIFRATSSYLLGQYFRKMHTGEDDFTLSGLEEAYHRLHEVNVGMARRMRHASSGDAKLNAIVRLDMFTHELPYVISEKLAGLAPYFEDYWKEKDDPAL